MPLLPQYDGRVSATLLVEHLRRNALQTGGRFTLRSGATSTWYLDARQTTFDGEGARLVGEAVLDALLPEVEAVGGMTLGADPMAVATAMVAIERGRRLRAFSVRKAAKEHGTGGRLVGPVDKGSRVAVLEDTTTTGGAVAEAVECLVAEGVDVAQVVVLVDRSGGAARARFDSAGIPYTALVTPDALGVAE